MSAAGDDAPWPTVHEAELDDATLDALVGDIARETRVLAVMVKGGATALAEGGGVTLEEAVAMLRAGHVRAVQARYEHRGQTWSDTLLRGATGVRIVRIAM